MKSSYRRAHYKIKIFLLEHPALVKSEPKLKEFLVEPSRTPLLPKTLGEGFIDRMAHPEGFRSLNQRYTECKEYALVLEFIIENYELYSELAEQNQEQLSSLCMYERDLSNMYSHLNSIRCHAEDYRRTFREGDLELKRCFPISRPPESSPQMLQTAA